MNILNESQDQQDAEFSFGAVSAKGQPPTFVDIHHKGHGQQDLRDLKPGIPWKLLQQMIQLHDEHQ